MLRNIAKSGLKGRPRQTKILLVALILAFFFVTVSFLLLSTANQTRQDKRRDTFGDWQAVYANESPERLADIKASAGDIANVRLIGQDDAIGLVGAADEAFWAMSHIDVIEGRLPEALDEIVIEQGQLSYFQQAPQVGDTLRVAATIRHGDLEEDAQSEIIYQHIADLNSRFEEAIARHWDEVYQQFLVVMDQRFDGLEEEVGWTVEFQQSQGQEADFDEILAARIADTEEMRQAGIELFEQAPESPEDRLFYFRQYIAEKEQSAYQSMLENETQREIYSFPTEEEYQDFIYSYFGPGGLIRFAAEQFRQAGTVRTVPELEGFSGTTLQTRTRMFTTSDPYRYLNAHSMAYYFGEYLPRQYWPEFTEFNDLQLSQEAVMLRHMTIVGIIQDYHTMWDGPIHLYPTAFVTPQTGAALLDDALGQSRLESNRAHVAGHHIFLLDEDHPAGEGETYFINQLAKDAASGISEDLISRVLLLVFGLITGFSIFQISLVQLKKRQRKFALMRSIGATLSQIRRLMIWEAIIVLLIALPLGILLGFGVAWVLIRLNNQLMNDQVQLVFEGLWLIIGLVVTLIASLIGLFSPLRRLEDIPLRGQIEVIDQAATKQARQILGDQPIRQQSLSSINRRHYRFIRKQRLISSLLYSLILFILLGSLWLIYLSFQEYRSQVIDTDMPDFEFVRGHQVVGRYDRQMMEEIAQAVPIERQDLFIRGDKAFLWYDDIENNQLLNHLLGMLPESLQYDYYSTELVHVLPAEKLYLTQEAMVVDTFSLDTESDYIDRFRDIVSPDFDWDAFERGEQVILLSPGYELGDPPGQVAQANAERLSRAERMKALLQETGSGYLSYDSRRTPVLEHEPSFEGLTSITLTVPTGQLLTFDQAPSNTVTIHELPVGLVLKHLPRQGMWPLSDSLQNPVVLMSRQLMERVYPHRMHIWGFGFSSISRAHRSERYANTLIHLYLSDPTDEQALEIKRIGLEYDYAISNLYLIKQRLYAKGLQTSLIVGLLGLALLVVALQIQSTSARGMLEAERSRIGILQSLGVRSGEYRSTYLLDAFKRMLMAVLLTHIALVIVIGLYLLITRPERDVLLEMQISLSAYPWLIHGLIVVAFLFLGTIAAFLPLGNILKRQPVENIRSLQ